MMDRPNEIKFTGDEIKMLAALFGYGLIDAIWDARDDFGWDEAKTEAFEAKIRAIVEP